LDLTKEIHDTLKYPILPYSKFIYNYSFETKGKKTERQRHSKSFSRNKDCIVLCIFHRGWIWSYLLLQETASCCRTSAHENPRDLCKFSDHSIIFSIVVKTIFTKQLVFY